MTLLCIEILTKIFITHLLKELQASRDVIYRLRRRDLFVCASETLLSPNDCKILGTNSSRIKEEILIFKRKNYENNDLEVDKIGHENSDESFKSKLLNCDDVKPNSEAELLLNDQICKLEAKDIFCRVFKMGFGKGKENPVTASTSFFRPVKNMEIDSDTNIGGNVTYTEGIVHSSTFISLTSVLILSVIKNHFRMSFILCFVFFLIASPGCLLTFVFLFEMSVNCSRLIPTEFEETYLRMFCRYKSQSTAVSRLYTRVSTEGSVSTFFFL